MNQPICENLEKIHLQIKTCCEKTGRNPEEIQLVAISKTKPASDVDTAWQCGQLHFGENRVDELVEKMEETDKMEKAGREDIIWHFVGPMQTNKIKYLAGRVDWIQSIYKKKYLKELEKRAGREDRVVQVLIQVNISGESQKQGCEPEQVPQLLEYARDLEHVRIRGLMGMASFTDDKEVIRKQFRLLRNTLEANLDKNGGAVQLEHLSMGMTHDLEIAIEEGSTMVRVGTAIFGERDYD